MANRDQASDLSIVQTIPPAAYVADETGVTVDTLGYDSVTIVASSGDTVDAGLQISIEHGDAQNGSDAVALTPVQTPDNDKYLYGPAYAPIPANTEVKYAYVGSMRYVRIESTIPGASDFAGFVILGRPHEAAV